MEKQSAILSRYLTVLLSVLALFGLYVSNLYSYLLFHSLAELFSIIVAFGVFVVAWNSRRWLDNNYLLFIGIAYLFIASLDLIHTLAYTGMGVFRGYGTNLPAQLWIAARYLQSLSLLIAPLFFGWKLRLNLVLSGYAAVTALLLASIFYWNIFPQSFVEGVGLTPFKKVSEYIISLIFLGSVALLAKNRRQFDRGVLQLLVVSIAVAVASELAFTLYVDPYGLFNMFGHFLKIISFYLIYKALIETGLRKPYNLLFRDLKQSEEALKKHRDQLEDLVQERTAELRRSEERYRNTLGNMLEGCQIISFDWRYLYVNDAAARHGRHTKEELLGHTIMEMYPGIEDTEMFDYLRRCMENRTSHRIENEFTYPDGDKGWFELSIEPVLEGVFILSLDITERKQAEESLKQTLAELARSNEELQRFAYVTSHDLQEPLRMVASYVQLLERRYKDKLDADAHDFINFAVEGTKRMQALINDLLAYSRVDSRAQPFEPTNMEKAFEAAMANLQVAIKESKAEVTREPLPTVMADEGQMVRVFQNLLSNAIKFHGKEPPRVHVSAEQKGNEWIFSVKDNGIGIDPQYFDRIFIIFQRLHGQEYPGTGAGLSITKRIVERHGGRIWVESAPGKGSTFYFSIPVKGGKQI